MIEKLIEKMFASRNAAHIEHWKTKSYATHKALGKFYEDVIDSLDKYVEAHQGTFGIVGDIKGEVDNIAKQIHDDIIWLNKNRDEITKGIPALENIIDEIKGELARSIFKLRRLE